MGAESAANPLVLELAAWVVTYALHSTVLLCAALLAFTWIQSAARRSPRLADAAPGLRERIGKVALLAGLVTASLQTAFSVEPFGLRPALVEAPADSVVVGAQVASPLTQVAQQSLESPVVPSAVIEHAPQFALPAVPLYFLPAVYALRAAAEASLPTTKPAQPPDGLAAAASAPVELTFSRTSWILALLVVWSLVVITACARRLVGWNQLRHSLLGSELVTDPFAVARFEGLCRLAGVAHTGSRGATLRVAPLLASPMARGILHPEVYVPPRALRDLDEDEFAALLSHELAHVARRDAAWLITFRVLEVVFCLQPLNRIVARRLEDDAELLCDDRAVVWTGERIPLASCLTEVASWLVPAAREPRLAVGMAAHGARLTRRVERLVDDGHVPDAGARRPVSTLVALVFAACAIVVVPGFAAQRSAKPLPLHLRFELALDSQPTHQPIAVENDADVAGDPCEEPTEHARDDVRAEVLEAAPSRPASSPAIAHSGAAPIHDPQVAATPLAGVLQELSAEIATLRANLRERDGGAELERDLERLMLRVASLRAREVHLAASLEGLLAPNPHILLSPTEAGRTAEDL